MAQHGETAGAFDDDADCGAVARAQDQIRLVMTGDQAILHFRGTFVHEHHIRDLALRSDDASTQGFARAVLASQTLSQLAL